MVETQNMVTSPGWLCLPVSPAHALPCPSRPLTRPHWVVRGETLTARHGGRPAEAGPWRRAFPSGCPHELLGPSPQQQLVQRNPKGRTAELRAPGHGIPRPESNLWQERKTAGRSPGACLWAMPRPQGAQAAGRACGWRMERAGGSGAAARLPALPLYPAPQLGVFTAYLWFHFPLASGFPVCRAEPASAVAHLKCH